MTATILLVEHDERLRTAVRRLLEVRGYTVVEVRPGSGVDLTVVLDGRGTAPTFDPAGPTLYQGKPVSPDVLEDAVRRALHP
jgi:hypothetical protein